MVHADANPQYKNENAYLVQVLHEPIISESLFYAV